MELTNENYFEYKEDEGVPVLSSSFLKNGMPMWNGNPLRLETIYQDGLTKESTKAMQFGSLVHSFAEDRTRFVFEPEWEMSDTIRGIADKMITTLRNTGMRIFDSPRRHEMLFNTVCVEVRWGQSWKDATRLTKFIDAAHLYWMFCLESEGKIVVTGKEVEKLSGVVKGIEAAGLRVPLLDNNTESSVEVYRELAIKFKIENLPAKALLDILEINHDKKQAIIIDLKTTSNKIENFITGYSYRPDGHGTVQHIHTSGDYIRYAYFFQEFFYRKAVAAFLQEKGFEAYTIRFLFGVVETSEPFIAKIITPNAQWMAIANFEYESAMGNVNSWMNNQKYLEF